ncbi:MAG: hypothetical protein Q8P40_15820 [Nitrospirota bacterium]|nr:hypothetical protein [Nitrospirota bacterium]
MPPKNCPVIAANAKIGIYFMSIWEMVLTIKITGIGTCMQRNQRREYLFALALA